MLTSQPQQAPALPAPEAAPAAEVAAAAMAGDQAPAAEPTPAADPHADAAGAGLIDAAVTGGAAGRQEPEAGSPSLPAGPSEAAVWQEPVVAAEASQGSSSVQPTGRQGPGSAAAGAAAAEAAVQEGEVQEPGDATTQSPPSSALLGLEVSAGEQPKRHRWVWSI